jgi:divalent metal cation (Fe/Co/Zn/Cd) transporter
VRTRCPDACCQPSEERGEAWHSAARKAKRLSWLSLAYMAAEGLIAIIAAVLAGSVALLGLAGLLGNTLLGLWWLDPAVGLLIAGLAVREGLQAWHGEECC